MSPERGFTLVELMVTVAVIGILAGIGVPYLLVHLPTIRVNAAVRQVVGDFRLARTRAVEEGRDLFVQFAPAQNRYTLYQDFDGNGAFDPSVDRPVKTVDLSALYPGIAFATYSSGQNPSGGSLPADGVSFVSDRAQFHPRGTAGAGGVYLRPSKDAGVRRDRERGVTVIVPTGRARAFRWTGATATGWE